VVGVGLTTGHSVKEVGDLLDGIHLFTRRERRRRRLRRRSRRKRRSSSSTSSWRGGEEKGEIL